MVDFGLFLHSYLAPSMRRTRPLQIVLVDFKKVATKSAKKLLKSFREIGKVATEFQKVATYAAIFGECL